MPILRTIAAVLAAAILAFGLSVGAALAEGEHPAPASHLTKWGLCPLKDAPGEDT